MFPKELRAIGLLSYPVIFTSENLPEVGTTTEELLSAGEGEDRRALRSKEG